MRDSMATVLRQALARPQIVVAPGVYDCITARLAAEAGFPCAYMSGACVSAALGFPDRSLATLTEFAVAAAHIARAIEIPLIADADTGFGNELNVIRTVQAYEACGVAAIQLEDQVFPKRCGHLDGKQVSEAGEFLAKISAAASARTRPETVLIARTDARGVLDLESAIERVNAAFGAGADVAFIEAPESLAEVSAIPRRVAGPCLFNLARGGKSPVVEVNELQRLGYRLAIVPGLLLTEIVTRCAAALASLRSFTDTPLPDHGLAIRDLFDRLGGREWDALAAAASGRAVVADAR
jgi:2-methylisocitrate lyase-like PEP mutase family enzyme